MDKIPDSFDDNIALEKMNITRFNTSYTVRRASQAPIKFDTWSTLALPTGSVFHTLNGFETLEAPDGGLPNAHLPPLVNEKLPVWIKLHTQLAGEHSQPFGIDDNYTYRPNKLSALLSHFYQTHRRFHRVLSDRMLGSMTGVLTWVDYSPLNEVKVGGTLHAYRKFDLLFRTILDMVVTIGGGKHHYILLPQGNHVFGRSVLQRSFRELSTGTLNGLSHDPSIFAVLHVLGYIYGKTKDIPVTPYKEDVRILGKTDPLFSKVRSTSLLERLPTDLFSSINFIFQKDNKAVVYNMADLATFSDDATFYPKFYRHIMNLRLMDSAMPVHDHLEDDDFDAYVEQAGTAPLPIAVVTPASGDIPVVEPVQPPTPGVYVVENSQGLHHDDVGISHVEAKTFEDRLRTATILHTAPIIELESKKESKRNTLLDNHLKATLAGKALGELVQPLATQVIAPKVMSFVTSAPESSYQKSSLVSMDKAYQSHAYHHELAKVVGSLAKHGMFISKIEEDKVHTEMDRTTTYKLHLSDLGGKTHHVKFTVPDVDENGLMKISGIDYRLTRQIANIPICKISPVRVNLSSYYNKIIVERVQSKRYSYEQDINKLLLSLKASGLIRAVAGSTPLPTTKVAYDYTAIGRNFTEIDVGDYVIHFGEHLVSWEALEPALQEQVTEKQVKTGTIVGVGPAQSLLVWDRNNQISQIKNQKIEKTWTSFNQMLVDILGDEALPDRTALEWTQANIINQTIPLVYILAYKLGLKTVLDMINLDYRFYPKKDDVVTEIDDIAVPMEDGVLVFNRYPLARSLIATGLLWADLKTIQFRDLSVPETYGKILQQKGMSIGVLKGLNGFYDFFVDPITETVLEKMGEPITFAELLLRANVMLTDYHADESSSVKLHRFRLYERFNGTVYNEIYRALANHRGNPTSKKSFSINPEAVFLKIVQDATISPNEVINPVHEVKQRANFTFTGAGGRKSNSFILKDRIYPKDGLGVISDAVPDSGKVSITAYLSASPNIDDIHGIPKPYKDGDVLEPPQILSIGSMVMPGGTTDDGKRNSYLSIQISHYVPNHQEGETLAVRTGYDAVLPHLSSGVFSISAEDDGIVESIDDVQKVLKVRYADAPVISLHALKLPYLDTVLDTHKRDGSSVGYLVPEALIAAYPIGGVFSLTKNTYGKIVDRLRCETVDAIPDKDMLRKQAPLVQELTKGKVKALYYVRFTLMGNTTPGTEKAYSFASIYSQNSGSYLLQTRVPHVKVGESFKTGDILIYNPGFFVPDPMSKQVTFKHGVLATIALVEKSSNHEDACEISRDLANKLRMVPSHQREIITKKDAVVLGMVKLGDHVEVSDALCVISDEYLIGSSAKLNAENLDIIEKLNRQSPPADYTGVIKKIRLLYSGDREKLSPSLKLILKDYEKEVRDAFKALSTDEGIKPPEKPGWVAVGTRYQGITFAEDTVILEFMIEETLGMAEGDKLVVSNANKSIVSHVSEKQHLTESGIPVDMLFSTTSIINRIVASPLTIGIAERNMTALKEKALSLYFD